ncbi:MAG: hypothetical protein KA224_02545 [Steroidobacteraceae bacterium]|nr:hypothetical protein [Steroidobacteraceae bacterium]MBP8176168.1 hypothetical protein [Xanthomonadales bacterium]
MGGAGAEPVPPAGGVRSMLAPWAGGAGAIVPTTTTGGPRSLLAFWIGGAGAQIEVAPPPPAPPPTPIGSRPSFRYPVPADLQALNRARLIDDDELLLLMAAQIAAAGLLH